jgi:hypothetical protein
MTAADTTFAHLCDALDNCPEGDLPEHLAVLADWLEENHHPLAAGLRQAIELDVIPSRDSIWASWAEGRDQDDAPVRDDTIVSSLWARLDYGHGSYTYRAGVTVRVKSYVGRWGAYSALAEALKGD